MIHNKQFIICNKKYEREDFKYIKLSTSLYLSYQENLKVNSIETELGRIYLLGIVFQTLPNKQSPLDELLKISDEEDILECLSCFSGRYLLITAEKVYTDFSASLGVFYGKVKDTVIISSSLSLIKELFGLEEENYINLKDSGLKYYPVPLTVLKGIKKLLCSEILSFKNNEIVTVSKNYKIDYSYLSEEKTYETFIEYFKNLIKNISLNWKGTLFLPLTGGVDSRTILAFLLKENIDFVSYVAYHSKGLVLSDRITGKIFSNIYKFKHIFLKKSNFSKKVINERKKEFDRHCYNTTIEEDRYYYSVDIYKKLKKYSSPLLLRGNIWEASIKEDDILEGINFFINNFSNEKLKITSLKEWENNVKNNKIDLDFGMRFYLEQRLGGWSSYNSQAEDLNNIDFFSPINNQVLMSLLWNLPVYEGIDNKTNQLNIIRKVNEKFLDIPINKKYKIDFFIKIIAYIKINGIKVFLKKILKKIGLSGNKNG